MLPTTIDPSTISSRMPVEIRNDLLRRRVRDLALATSQALRGVDGGAMVRTAVTG